MAQPIGEWEEEEEIVWLEIKQHIKQKECHA